MAVAFVTFGQGSNWTGASVGTLSTGAFAVAAGQFIIVVGNDILPPGVVITDTAGNSYIPGTAGTLPFWFAKNTLPNATNVVTATFTAQSFVYLVAAVFSGVDLVNPIDQTTGASSSAVQNPSTPSVNTQFAQEGALSWVDSGDTGSTVGGGWTAIAQPGSPAELVQYQILAAKQALAAAASESTLATWSMGMVTFVGAGQRVPPLSGDVGPGFDFTYRL
jgi:hypothetical protein